MWFSRHFLLTTEVVCGAGLGNLGSAIWAQRGGSFVAGLSHVSPGDGMGYPIVKQTDVPVTCWSCCVAYTLRVTFFLATGLLHAALRLLGLAQTPQPVAAHAQAAQAHQGFKFRGGFSWQILAPWRPSIPWFAPSTSSVAWFHTLNWCQRVRTRLRCSCWIVRCSCSWAWSSFWKHENSHHDLPPRK